MVFYYIFICFVGLSDCTHIYAYAINVDFTHIYAYAKVHIEIDSSKCHSIGGRLYLSKK
jgi:hypothetical protein